MAVSPACHVSFQPRDVSGSYALSEGLRARLALALPVLGLDLLDPALEALDDEEHLLAGRARLDGDLRQHFGFACAHHARLVIKSSTASTWSTSTKRMFSPLILNGTPSSS